MKYILEYNNHTSYYTTCSSQELSDLVDTNDFIHLSKLDTDMILSIGLVEIDPDDRYKWCEFKVDKQFDSGDSLYLFSVWKCDDEWFYLELGKQVNGYSNICFKCDQIDGLVRCIEDCLTGQFDDKIDDLNESIVLESHSVEKLYYYMDEDDWRDEVRLLFGEKCSLSEKQVNELSVLFKIHHWKNVGASLDCTNLYIRFDNHLKEFELYNGTDEWFYVKGYVEVAPNRIVDEYIKCDQWDGLVAYLTDSLGKFGCVKNQMSSESVLYSKVIEDDINTIDDDQKGLDFTDKEKDEISRALISVDYKGRHIVNAFDIQYRKIKVSRSYPKIGRAHV